MGCKIERKKMIRRGNEMGCLDKETLEFIRDDKATIELLLEEVQILERVKKYAQFCGIMRMEPSTGRLREALEEEK